ncbi:UNVERIFIED_CONTAM: hypothetical protein RMT77_017669 [Armadillidium vulgare]
MDFKCKIEIKEEELDLEYDSYQQDSQIFPSNEANFTLAEGIKNEELDEKTLIKSELRESHTEYIFDEELANNDVIKSENQMMVEKKFCFQNLKSLITNAAEGGEKDSKRKITSRSKSHRAVLYQQYIKKNYVENPNCGYCNFSFKSKNEFKKHLKTYIEREYKCPHCSYESNLKAGLELHLLTHCNTKLFKCSHCSYACNQKVRLINHMLLHANVSRGRENDKSSARRISKNEVA